MHFNKLQRQDQIQNTDNAPPSLPSDRGAIKVTPVQHTLELDTFTESATSCTSSTDSGVNVSDSEAAVSATAPPSPYNQFRENFHRNSANLSDDDKTIDNKIPPVSGDDRYAAKVASIFDKKFKNEHQTSSSSNESNYNSQNTNQSGNNVIHNNSYRVTKEDGSMTAATLQNNQSNDPLRAASPAPSSVISSSDSAQDPPSRQHAFNRSPAVSIRSIDSSVIDSDSDSDVNGDIEGVHENYVIKKLGTQVSYPPQHPDIPKINNGLKVVDQQITPNGMAPTGLVPPSPLAVISAMGDSMSRMNSPGQAGQLASVSQVPQIAVSGSKDITIGDKHFYEGPVTIQQFLIDSRDKWREGTGKDNPTFQDDSGGNFNNAKDINSSPASSSPGGPYAKLWKRKKFLVPGVLAVIALLVLAIVLAIEASSSDSKNTTHPNNPNTDVIDDECVEGKLCLVKRDTWRAHAQTAKLDPQTLPLHRVVIAHTASEPCDSVLTCRDRVRVIQEFHMKSFGWDDIGYNFLISSEGRVYIGRGWDDIGAHTKGYNTDSVGIAFIGTYTTSKPSEAQLNACRLLIEEGVRLKKLVPEYKLYGARQLSATESPGDALYRIIRNWEHWSPKI